MRSPRFLRYKASLQGFLYYMQLLSISACFIFREGKGWGEGGIWGKSLNFILFLSIFFGMASLLNLNWREWLCVNVTRVLWPAPIHLQHHPASQHQQQGVIHNLCKKYRKIWVFGWLSITLQPKNLLKGLVTLYLDHPYNFAETRMVCSHESDGRKDDVFISKNS